MANETRRRASSQPRYAGRCCSSLDRARDAEAKEITLNSAEAVSRAVVFNVGIRSQFVSHLQQTNSLKTTANISWEDLIESIYNLLKLPSHSIGVSLSERDKRPRAVFTAGIRAGSPSLTEIPTLK